MTSEHSTGLKCKRHRRETALTCTSCGTPICPDCAVSAAVGFKCPDCARPARTIYDIPPAIFVKCLVVTLAVGLIGRVVLTPIPLFGALIYGIVVGEVAFITSSRRSGAKVEGIAIASILSGTFILPALITFSSVGWDFSRISLPSVLGFAQPWTWVGLFIAIYFALYRLRNR